jgi:hypothetical protein
LLGDVLRGSRRRWDRARQLGGLLLAFLRPSRVRDRLERLRALGHLTAIPTVSQILIAGRDQIIISASAETKMFYESQGIPWIFHNVRRFLSGPATVLDPVGLFSPRDTIIHHVLQTFHRHAVYDLVLLRAFPDGLDEMERQAAEMAAGTHPHQRALASLIEDGSYHARLPQDIRAFRTDPLAPARALPAGLVDEPVLMLAMDQFKDVRGFTDYASRLDVGPFDVLSAAAALVWNGTLGALWSGLRVGPGRNNRIRQIQIDCCDPELVARYGLSAPSPRAHEPGR